MKKALDQTVRDIKRGVNKNILKVPRIERKVLDATSNESWGPHGSNLAEIAQASYNNYEYQIIMAIVWRRLNDSGKNWRHVYKGLTVLEYLVANGSERVIGEIRAHAYQISSLSGFQYIDSKGRDQGSNVRKKSQSLIAIVNDEEKIMEVREKASANKDKYNGSSTGRPDSGYGDHYDVRQEDHFQHRDDNGKGDERYKDEDKYGRDHDGHNGTEKYRDDDHRGHEQEEHNGYGLENKSADELEHSSKEEDRNVVMDNTLRDERSPEFKLSDQHVSLPPSYEEAVKNADNPISDERNGKGTSAMPAQSNASPPASTTAAATSSMLFINEEHDAFDDFDPRGPISAAPNITNDVEMDLFGSAAPTAANNSPTVANNVEMDLFGSLSMEDSINSLALVPATSISATSDPSIPIKLQVSSVFNQSNTNPFEDAPFHAVPQENSFLSLPNNVPSASFQDSFVSNSRHTALETMEAGPGHEFGEIFHSIPSNSSIPNGQPTSTALGFQTLETSDGVTSFDILEGILPTNGPSSTFPPQHAVVVSSTRAQTDHSDFLAQPVITMPVASLEIAVNQYALPEKMCHTTSQTDLDLSGLTNEIPSAFTPQAAVSVSPARSLTDHPDFLAQAVVSMPVASQEILPVKLPEVTSQNDLNSPGLTNELTSAFPPQASLSIAPTRAPIDHSNLSPLPTESAPVSSPALLPQYYSQPDISTLVASQNMNGAPGTLTIQAALASQNINGAPSTLPKQAALTTLPIMTQIGHPGFHAQPTAPMPVVPQVSLPNYLGQQETTQQVGPVQHLNGGIGSGSSLQASPSFGALFTSQAAPSTASGPMTKPSQRSDKFETKSTVWADTISRGLVDLNISGPKVNPMAGIGVDFDSLNRKEKREKEKSSVTPVSTITMGKAMGSGSGMGRGAATGLAPPPNPMMGPGMGWGGGAGMGMGGFGGMNMGMGMGMGMNMGVGHGLAMHPNAGTLTNPAGISMAGNGYNPMSMNRYGSQPYGGAYR